MDTTIELYRCSACSKLITWKQIEKWQGCSCGSRSIRGGAPSGIFENTKVGWWWLVLTIKLNLEDIKSWIVKQHQ